MFASAARGASTTRSSVGASPRARAVGGDREERGGRNHLFVRVGEVPAFVDAETSLRSIMQIARVAPVQGDRVRSGACRELESDMK